MLSPLLSGFARAGDLQRALEVTALAARLRVDLQNAAVREFARAGGSFVGPALEIYREARAAGKQMSRGSVSKLIAACAAAGDEEAAMELLKGAEGNLDDALDLIHGLARQQRQRDDIEFDVRRIVPKRDPGK